MEIKQVKISALKEGQIIGKQVISSAGVLLEAGTLITHQHIGLLNKWRISTVWIQAAAKPKKTLKERVVLNLTVKTAREAYAGELGETPALDSIDKVMAYDIAPVPAEAEFVSVSHSGVVEVDSFVPPSGMNERDWVSSTYKANVADTEGIILKARANIIEEAVIINLVRKSIANLKINFEDTLVLTASDTPENYLVSHSLNGCILSLAMGMKIGMKGFELETLGIGALLHDIGMSKVDNLIWMEPRKLSETEKFHIWKHPIYGADILAKTKLFRGITTYVAYQHHERNDKSGYPKRRDARHTHKYSQIISAADVFAALTSARVYRPRYEDPDVLRLMDSMKGFLLNQEFASLITEIGINHGLIDPGMKLKVLVVEDCGATAKLIQHYLKHPNLEIHWAENGRVGLEKTKALKPDMVLLDLMMPEMSGYEYLTEVRKDPAVKDTRVLVVTAKATKQDVETGKILGILGFVRKPFDEATIRDKVHELLGLGQQQ